MKAIESFEIEVGDLNIMVSVICFECFDGFSDMWEGSDKHHGWVTVTNLEAGCNSWKYFIPKQISLSELAADYAKQGRDNPSGAAYQTLQDQLMRDLHACDYGFMVSAYVCGVDVLADTYVGCGFDYSYDDEGDLLDEARRLFDAGWTGIDLGDVVELEAGPYDFEWYWDTWECILNNAQFKDENGTVWYLHHGFRSR